MVGEKEEKVKSGGKSEDAFSSYFYQLCTYIHTSYSHTLVLVVSYNMISQQKKWLRALWLFLQGLNNKKNS